MIFCSAKKGSLCLLVLHAHFPFFVARIFFWVYNESPFFLSDKFPTSFYHETSTNQPFYKVYHSSRSFQLAWCSKNRQWNFTFVCGKSLGFNRKHSCCGLNLRLRCQQHLPGFGIDTFSQFAWKFKINSRFSNDTEFTEQTSLKICGHSS